jgi:DNA polymerase-1
MKHINHTKHNIFNLAILIKESALSLNDIENTYFPKLNELGMVTDEVVSFSLEYQGKKQSVKNQKAYLDKLLPEIDKLGITDLLVCDGDYFKTLTKQTKAEPHYGYVLPCKYPDYEHMNVVLCSNHQVLFFNPDMKDKINLSLEALANHKGGSYSALGKGIIHSESYPKTLEGIKQFLTSLHQYPSLSCDIETFSLKHYEAGIGTIGFAWDRNNGGAFLVDYCELAEPDVINKKTSRYAFQSKNIEVRYLLWQFFTTYKGKVIWHNASFDCTVLAYQLFMDNLIDQKGLIEGVKHMTKNIDDTKIIAYLATNSCAGNHLSLKDQAHEFAGNYAVEDIKDITLIEPDKLLEYNLVDCLSTWFVYNKHYQTMVDDDQLDIYENLMIPSIKTIVQVQLTGMCMDMNKVLEAEKKLTDIHNDALFGMLGLDFVQEFETSLRKAKIESDNKKLKTKKRTMADVLHLKFNPNSNPQLQELLFEVMGLPVLDFTTNKQPATGNKTVKKLINHCTKPEHKEFLEHLIDYIKVDKILSAFIPTFKSAPLAPDGMHYLYGNFNLGGTVSGRLSSNNPNLQQIPSGSTYAKLIKQCFVAPKGMLFVGADYASLEDRIDALLTKDTNKIRVYTDGYCGHCLRAFSYFGDQMPDIEDTVESINSIAIKYKSLRSDSKAPTFAATYGGTYKTFMTNLGWSEEKSKAVEANYNMLYAESLEYKKNRIAECAADGYATVAFGLRVRTPLLQRVILDSDVTPYAAAAEGRTVGNAMGQSYGLLNNRACNEVMKKVWDSPYIYDIYPCAQIHDAIYFRVKDSASHEALVFLNQIVGDAMSWQGLAEIEHPSVGLSGEIDIFYPSWNDDYTIPNGASKEDIVSITYNEKQKREE